MRVVRRPGVPSPYGAHGWGREGVRGYFEHFMQKNPTGTVIEDKGKGFHECFYYRAGKYDFATNVNGVDGLTHARYDYIWVNIGGKWFIQHHHSSELPKPKDH